MQTSQVRIILTTDSIFQRINQSEKRSDSFDLISAVSFSTEFDLPVKFKKDINKKLKMKGSILSLLPELGAMDSERRADEVTRPSTSQAG